MKDFLHPDYWIEIPAGIFLIGISSKQRSVIIETMHERGMYSDLSVHQLHLLESIRRKWQVRTEHVTKWYRTRIQSANGLIATDYPGIDLNDEEKSLYTNRELMASFYLEMKIHEIPLDTEVYLDQFYISQFPVTNEQYSMFNRGIQINNLPGVFDTAHKEGEYKRGARVNVEASLRFCSEIGGRLPTELEWEKAARGVDGRIYPWGNVWDLLAGYFYYGQGSDVSTIPPEKIGNKVDGYPKGVSPYDVWRMVGSEPELVVNIMGNISSRGCHPKVSSAQTAWLDHMISMPGNGDFVALRPVIDKWPPQH